jgi:hypothetical protein
MATEATQAKPAIPEVQRYGQKRDFEDYPTGQVRKMADGDLVLYEDYRKLESSRDALLEALRLIDRKTIDHVASRLARAAIKAEGE